jgi:lipoprotein-releasing system ATP-binding protein
MKRTALKGVSLHKTFKDIQDLHVLKGVSLEIALGESVAIVGKSGEGKSTLLHILGALEAPSSGKLYILDEEVTPSRAPLLRNRRIGFVFQAFNLLEEYTLIDNVLMPARIGRTFSSTTLERALFLLQEVGLYERKDSLAKGLSGGEKQRAAIARALLNDPDIILADEPTGNLDHGNSQKVHELLFKACQEFKKALVIVTHDRDLAACCERNVILREGLLWNS